MSVSRAIALSVVVLAILAVRGGALRAMPRLGPQPDAGADPLGSPLGAPVGPIAARATSLRTFRRIGQFGGQSYAVDAMGDVALLGLGSHGDLLNLAGPEPVKVGTFEVAGTVIDVALAGEGAFVLEGAPGENRLHVVGVSSSGPLVEVAQLGVGDSSTFELADDLVFTGGPRGLGVIDVAGAAPVARGTVTATGSVEHLRVGPRFIVAAGGEEVSVLRRDGGPLPRPVGRWALPPGDGHAWSIVDVATGPTAADQTRALVLAYRYLEWPKGSAPRARDAGPVSPRPAMPTEVVLVVLDLADPAAPVEMGRLDLGVGAGVEFPQALAVAAGRAFVAASYYAGPRAPHGVSGTILEVDLTDPTAPVLVDEEVRFLAPSHDMTASGGRVLLAQMGGGLEVVDVTTPGHVVPAASYVTPYQPRAVAARAGTVLLGDAARDGVWLIDAADASDPTAAAHLDDLSLCWANCSAALFGATAVLADFNHGLQLFDAAGDRLVHRGVLDGTRRAISMSGSPDRLVLTAHPDGSRGPGQVVIADIVASPPVVLASMTITPYVGQAAAVEGRAYVLTGAGMEIVDTSNPRAPRIAGRTSFGGTWWRIAARANTVYLVQGDGTLHILDATDPTAPREVGWLDKAREDDVRPNQAWDVALAGDVLFVLHTSWLQAVSVRDPEHPREMAWVSEEALGLAGSLVSLAMDEGALYVASTDGGIAMVRFGRVEPVSVLLLPSLAR